jgi:CRP-like cAMP-binding protein
MTDFTSIEFEPGELIFNIGDTADHLYVIQQGTVEFLNADHVPFAKANAGESFGEQAFLVGGIRGATAKAVDAVKCLCISAQHANSLVDGVSPLLVPVFEALLLQQNMSNDLRHR